MTVSLMKFRSPISSVVLLACVALVVGCGRSDATRRATLSAIKNGQTSLVLKTVTPFEWDQVVVGRYDATKAELESVIGSSDEKFREFNRNVVFLRGASVVRCEHWSLDIEHPKPGEIQFEREARDRVFKFASSAKFRVSKVPIPGGEYFVLTEE